MRGLILAAGRGSRMGALCADRPKCLIELAGAPLIERQLAALRRGGADQIGIVRGYRAEMLQFSGVSYFDNARWEQTNMVMSLASAAAWLRAGPVVVSYADIFFRAELIQALVNAHGRLVIAYDRAWRGLWTRRFADPLSDAESFRIGPAGQLLEIGARAERVEAIQGQYMGLLKFTPEAWHTIEGLLARLEPTVRDRLDMTSLLRRLLAEQMFDIDTVGTAGHWGEIDSPTDLELYQEMSLQGELLLEDTISACPS